MKIKVSNILTALAIAMVVLALVVHFTAEKGIPSITMSVDMIIGDRGVRSSLDFDAGISSFVIRLKFFESLYIEDVEIRVNGELTHIHSIEPIQDPNDSVQSGVVNHGDVVDFYVKLNEELCAGERFTLEVTPKEGRGILYNLKSPEMFRGRDVLIMS